MTIVRSSVDSLAEIVAAKVGVNGADRLAVVARALAGAVPGAGSVLAEVISTAIPNQRLDRIADFLVLLADEVDRLSASDKLLHPSNTPLVEEGIAQATRAFSQERRTYLAKCVAYGVDADEMEKLNELKILRLLSEVGDDELLLLDAVSDPLASAKLETLKPPPLPANAPYECRAKGELHKASFRKLLAIGFLSSAPYADEPRQRRPEMYGALEDGPYISALGRMVLARVGLRS